MKNATDVNNVTTKYGCHRCRKKEKETYIQQNYSSVCGSCTLRGKKKSVGLQGEERTRN